MTDTSLPTHLTIHGMDCGHCASGIEKHLTNSGFADVSVSFATHSATVSGHSQQNIEQIVEAISELGYQVNLPGETGSDVVPFFTLGRKLAFCFVFTLPLFLHMFLSFSLLHNPFFQLLCCLPVFTVGLYHFGKSALSSLRIGAPNMDVLIVIGITASFVYSLVGTLFSLGPAYLFYETSATIITIVLFGNLLESRAVQKTGSALNELAKIRPAYAKKLSSLRDDAEAEDVPIESLQPEDLVRVNMGDTVPADGEIVLGSALINEAMITGESKPVERDPGASVIGGTLLEEGSITVAVKAVGQNTVLSQIIELVKSAQSKKPRIQRIGDVVSGYFVFIVCAIAAATFLGTLAFASETLSTALMRSIAVLVIACPCAMGLATPTAVLVGIGRAARCGILFRSGETLELLSKVKVMGFDKTGTLTTGAFEVDRIDYFEESSRSFAESCIYSLEQHSSHPVARSLIKELSQPSLVELENIEELKGCGIKADGPQSKQLLLGSPRWIRQETDVEMPDEHFDILLVCENRLLAGILLQDTPREGARDTIHALEYFGVYPLLISGDSRSVCNKLGEEVGIDAIYAERLPEQKLELIETYASSTEIAFVGDGINDAPSLSRATVGISLGGASDVAVHSSDVVVMGESLSGVADAIWLAQQTMRNIRQNLFWAFFYNSLAIPFAAAGFLNPMIAAFAMAASDVLIIGNSLRFRYVRTPKYT